MPISDPVIISASPAEEQPPPPDISAFTHTPCYCEENAYFLCKNLCRMGVTDEESRDLFVVFISNEDRRIPLWHQKASSRTDGLILWDYHVICIQVKSHGRGNKLHQVWDLDTTLPFPVPLNQYIMEAVRPSLPLDPRFTRIFRVVHAPLFLRCFASDRRHMKDSDGHWMSPPPTYEPIIAEDGTLHNLEQYIQMSAKDVVTNSGDLTNRIQMERFGVVMNEMQLEEFFYVQYDGHSS
ncbi:hypothetical protein H6P81_001908 [Aristolochia fimbriata]|uniref:Protein N-terminal glutamine amidohydrolase n=1 Tax=Aristolochia fimbriata TaxID=158543 RepID=A0AAV7F889_ARIFI|nr:hypothetical protein H6P81_001908 [Aristolochia fimbriata]